jgi:hypothetical protein
MISEKSQVKNYTCMCGKDYLSKQSLYAHKKKCTFVKPHVPHYEPTTPEIISLITELVKGHHLLQDSIIDICKNGTYNTTNKNSNNNTSHNNTNSNNTNNSFNLQFFLNETCKDAMNISEFVDSIKLQLSDLEAVGELGYVKGISNIIVKNLNAIDVTQRPVHCTDKKREVLYVKEDNKWEKENEQNDKLRRMIRRVAIKNYKQIKQFQEKYPDCNSSSSASSDIYNNIVIESMGGSGNKDSDNENKIIKNISKEVIIEK